MLIAGIMTLKKGELKISSSSISRGKPARTAGLLLVVALPAILVVAAVGAFAMSTSGTEFKGVSGGLGFITWAILIGCMVAALVAARQGIHR